MIMMIAMMIRKETEISHMKEWMVFACKDSGIESGVPKA
jgi:hypothetical protein